MSLSPDDHREALRLYESAIDAATHELSRPLYGPQRSRLLDSLTSLLTLRKLHKVRLQEMEEEEPVTLASEQYRHNELLTQPS